MVTKISEDQCEVTCTCSLPQNHFGDGMRCSLPCCMTTTKWLWTRLVRSTGRQQILYCWHQNCQLLAHIDRAINTYIFFMALAVLQGKARISSYQYVLVGEFWIAAMSICTCTWQTCTGLHVDAYFWTSSSLYRWWNFKRNCFCLVAKPLTRLKKSRGEIATYPSVSMPELWQECLLKLRTVLISRVIIFIWSLTYNLLFCH